jgi:hypothetical protein
MTNKAQDTQILKYGGEEGYKAEMRRRRSLVKTPGFKAMDKAKHLEISSRGGRGGKKRGEGGDQAIPS